MLDLLTELIVNIEENVVEGISIVCVLNFSVSSYPTG